MSGRQPKLLVLTSTYPRWPGDPTPMFVADLSAALTERFDVTVLAPAAAGAAAREQHGPLTVHRYRYGFPASTQLLANGAILPNLRRNRLLMAQVPPLVLGQLAAAWRLARREHFDAIHAHWLVPQGWVASLLRSRLGIPVLTTAHGADVHALRAAPLRRLKRHVLQASDRLTAVSEDLRAEMIALGADPERVTVLPMGVDTARFTPEAASPEVRGEFAAEGEPLLLFVGRLAEKKGVRFALEALPRILEAHPGTRLVIVGDGPERRALEAQTAHLKVRDHVTFTGARAHAELPALYASADVVLVPSVVGADGDREGAPVAVAEALASGSALVATDASGAAAFVRHAQSALLVPQRDPVAIAEAVGQLLDEPALRQRLGTAGRERAIALLSQSRIAEAYGDLIEDMLPARDRLAA